VMKEDRHCSGPREHRIHLIDVILKLYLFLDRPKAIFDALVSHNRITLEPAWRLLRSKGWRRPGLIGFWRCISWWLVYFFVESTLQEIFGWDLLVEWWKKRACLFKRDWLLSVLSRLGTALSKYWCCKLLR
jgi:hypothetical protein